MLMVSLIFSGWTMSLMPLARLVTNGLRVEVGTGKSRVTFRAHDGNLTLGFFDDEKFSAPPKLFDEIGLSAACGVRMAVTAWSKSKYFLATRSTSSTVTWR